MGRPNRSAWAIVAAVMFACGGKTGLLDETGTGGSGAAPGESGQAGGGNTGASGAGGRGGFTGPGGSTGGGGSAGVSGAAGISGTAGRGGSTGTAGVAGSAGFSGSGGVSSGGAGGAGGGRTEQIIDAMCARFEKFGCGQPTCREGLRTAVDHYNRYGCGDEWLEEQSCWLRDPKPCLPTSGLCLDYVGRFTRCIHDAGM